MRARRTLTCVKMYELPGVILLNNSMSLKLRQVEVILQPDAVKIFQTQAVESDSERADISSVVFFFPREETTDSTVIRNAFIPAPTGKLNSLLQDGGEEVGLYLGQLHTPPPPPTPSLDLVMLTQSPHGGVIQPVLSVPAAVTICRLSRHGPVLSCF